MRELRCFRIPMYSYRIVETEPMSLNERFRLLEEQRRPIHQLQSLSVFDRLGRRIPPRNFYKRRTTTSYSYKKRRGLNSKGRNLSHKRGKKQALRKNSIKRKPVTLKELDDSLDWFMMEKKKKSSPCMKGKNNIILQQ